MGQLFALFITICMTSGECHEAVLGFYASEQDCNQAMYEQRVHGECFVVEPGDDQRPAMK